MKQKKKRIKQKSHSDNERKIRELRAQERALQNEMAIRIAISRVLYGQKPPVRAQAPPKPQTADKMLLEAQRIVARLKTARAVLWFAVGLNVAGFVCSIITCLSNSN